MQYLWRIYHKKINCLAHIGQLAQIEQTKLENNNIFILYGIRLLPGLHKCKPVWTDDIFACLFGKTQVDKEPRAARTTASTRSCLSISMGIRPSSSVEGRTSQSHAILGLTIRDSTS